jgi:endonuclease YncB( thermonuclease family)
LYRANYYGPEATQKNRELVAGQRVFLEKDVSETDRYGRLLRYVYLVDGTMVNRELVRLGYAQVATFPPDVRYEAEMRAAQREAMAAGLGGGGLRPHDPPNRRPEAKVATVAAMCTTVGTFAPRLRRRPVMRTV